MRLVYRPWYITCGGTKPCGEGRQDGFSCHRRSVGTRARRMSLFHSGKHRQLRAFQRPDWRGFIVPKQTLSLAALFTQLPPSSSLKALQENTEKTKNNNKNPNKCCNTRHSHCLALFPVLPSSPCACIPPWAGSRAGPDPGDIQKLPADCCDPRPLATQDRTLASIKLLQMTTVASPTVQRVQQG